MRAEDGVALVTLGSPTRIFFDPEMSDALLEVMTALAGNEAVRVIVVTGGAPGYFVRHYSVAALVSMGERLKSSGQQWSEDTPYTPGSFASAEVKAYYLPLDQSRAARGYGVPSFRWKPRTPSGPAFNSRSMSGYVPSSPAVRSPTTRKAASFCVRFRK